MQHLPCLLTVALLAGCSLTPPVGAPLRPLPMDLHSHSRPNEVRVRHVRLDLRLDFEAHRVAGTAGLEFDRLVSDRPLLLDTKGLEITRISGPDGGPRPFTQGPADPLLGQQLEVRLQPGDGAVVIHYRTGPDAEALQWLTPAQTTGGKLPYLFTQGQAILTRSWIPLQDTPGVRVTYDARITAPEGMTVVMSAAERGRDAADPNVFTFGMPQPIPAYLIALACGDIAFAGISDRCGVFADPADLRAAVHEFADTETMLARCEAGWGKYGWGRYDVLVLPPAFPFGGMENPTLTFATPTIITGDRSLVALIAHEMAHSWSGNLVTNATWRDFWLNEGFTVYLEQRIMELVYGRERYLMEVETSMRGLREELAELPPKDQVLYIDLAGRNPDDAMTAVAYDKGAAFLRRLESVFGRKRFDRFLADYFRAHAFRSVTTDGFLAFLDEHLLAGDPAHKAAVDVRAWVFEPGLPATANVEPSRGFAEVQRYRTGLLAGTPPADVATGDWITHQWLEFINGAPASVGAAELRDWDRRFGLAASSNPEVRCAFLVKALGQGALEFAPQAREFVGRIGRRKFVLPVFKALVKHGGGKPIAREMFAAFRDRYHFVTRNSVAALLE